ncbi:MAG: TilS substrate-binding domain-containing protein, partial [Xanthomonadales bacterium]|nr:TilS substrate-binding domain-containing protein [Xanthomonadales bacterium]
GVRCQVDRVQVLERTEVGLEAKARAARREAYSHHLDPADWMLLAHHQRDQAETVMLRLLAGAGPRGLAAMAEVSELPLGRIGRPLLRVTDAQMQASIEATELPWVEDPANADHQHERSWLRASIMPPLRQRKPSLDQHLARLADWQRELSAGLSRQAAALLIERRDADGSLRLENWAALPETLRFELLCAWLASHGQPRAGRVLFERFEIELVAARGDAEPSLQCHAGWLRRYRQRAFWMSADGSGAQRPEPGASLPAYGRLGAPLVVAEHQLLSQSEPGCSAALPTGTAFRIDLRRGGERLRPAQDRP